MFSYPGTQWSGKFTLKEMGYSNLYVTHGAENAHNESYGCHLQKSKIKTEFHQLVWPLNLIAYELISRPSI